MEAGMQDSELQQLVQRQVAQFCERVGQALAPLEESPDRVVSDTAIHQSLLYVSSAVDIATGPVPGVNLVDLLVFLRLCREAIEKHWIPNVYGAQGAEVATVFARSRDDLWRTAASAIDETQRRELESLIDDWSADNPDQFRVEGIRLADFAERAGKAAQGLSDRARGLISGIKSASKAADQALLLAERGMFLVNRMPFLWRLQARVASREIVSDILSQLWAVPLAVGHLALSAPTKLLRRVTAGRSL
jgi:hypothetical protein